MIIITDTREQLPLWSSHKVKLDVGDYTTWTLRNRFHIERKSPADLYGTLNGGYSRFKREFIRAIKTKTKLVVYIECTVENFLSKSWSGSKYCKLPLEGTVKRIATLTERYGLEFVWCTSRLSARVEIFDRLEKEEARHRRRAKTTGRSMASKKS